MNKDIIEGKWTELKGSLKEQWGALTNDELDRVKGRWQELEGILQKKYGESSDSAKQKVRDFESNVLRKFKRSDSQN